MSVFKALFLPLLMMRMKGVETIKSANCLADWKIMSIFASEKCVGNPKTDKLEILWQRISIL